MRRVLRIVLLGVGSVLGAVVLAGGLWALFWTWYNPTVPLADPVVVVRPASGEGVVVVLGGDFAPTDAAMPSIRERGWRYPYEATAGILRGADVAFLNLEAPGHGHLRIGFLARLHVAPRTAGAAARLASVELLPIVTQNSMVQFRPRPLDPSESAWLSPFLAGTRARGTAVRVEGTTVRVELPP